MLTEPSGTALKVERESTARPLLSAFDASVVTSGGNRIAGKLMELDSERALLSIADCGYISECVSFELRIGRRTLLATPASIRHTAGGSDLIEVIYTQEDDAKDRSFALRDTNGGCITFGSDFIQNFKLYGNLVAVSAESIAFSLPQEVLILPGQVSPRSNISLGRIGIVLLDLTVVRTAVENGKRLVHCGFDAKSPHVREKLTQFAMLNYSQDIRCVDELKQRLSHAHLGTSRLDAIVTVSIASTPTEYADAVAIRTDAYSSAGKIERSAATSEMNDDIDGDTVVIIARIDRLVVGTVRMTRQRDGMLPFRRPFPDIRITPDASTCEISRLAVAPAFQRSDVLISLMRTIVDLSVFWRMKIGYVLVASDLERLYRACGARRLGQRIPHTFKQGETLALYSFELKHLLPGTRVVPLMHLLIIWPAIRRYAKYGLLPARFAVFMPLVVGRLMLIYRTCTSSKRRRQSK